jgi:hypothetical protein
MRSGVFSAVKSKLLFFTFLVFLFRSLEAQCVSEIEEVCLPELALNSHIEEAGQGTQNNRLIISPNPTPVTADPASCFLWRPRNDLFFQVRDDLMQILVAKSAGTQVGNLSTHGNVNEDARAKAEKEKKIARVRQTLGYLAKYADAFLNIVRFSVIYEEPEPSNEDLEWLSKMVLCVQSVTAAIHSYQKVLKDPEIL